MSSCISVDKRQAFVRRVQSTFSPQKQGAVYLGAWLTCVCCPEVSYLIERGHQLFLPLRRMSLDLLVSSLHQVAHFWKARVRDLLKICNVYSRDFLYLFMIHFYLCGRLASARNPRHLTKRKPSDESPTQHLSHYSAD